MSADVSWVATYPPHLRGFVSWRVEPNHLRGRLVIYYWGVKNWHTGQIIASDNTGCSFEDAMNYCRFMVTAARGAWMWELSNDKLRRN